MVNIKKRLRVFIAMVLVAGAIVDYAIIKGLSQHLDVSREAKSQKPCMIATDDFPSEYAGEFSFTHYAKTGNRTATQSIPRINKTVAVDPNVIPLHSIIYIENMGYFVAEDTGSKVKGNKIDVYVEDAKLAKQLGTLQGKKLKVWIMKQGAENEDNN